MAFENLDTDYPLSDWQYEVANGDTRLGYQDWLAVKRQFAEDEIGNDLLDRELSKE